MSESLAFVDGSNESRLAQPAHLLFRVSPHFLSRRILLLVMDALCINAAILVSLWAWARIDGQSLVELVGYRWLWFPLLTASWWGLAWLGDLYTIPVATMRLAVLRRITAVLAIKLLNCSHKHQHSLFTWFLVVFQWTHPQ